MVMPTVLLSLSDANEAAAVISVSYLARHRGLGEAAEQQEQLRKADRIKAV